MIDAIKITLVASCLLLVPTIIAGDMYWLIFWLGTACCLSLSEFISYKYSGKTLSSRFEQIPFKYRVTMIVGIGLFYIYLIGHLFFKW